MLILKLTDSNLRTRNGFQWPESGPVECPDFSPVPDCDSGKHGGLHGWANGEGDYRHSSNEGCWLIVEVPDELVIHFDGKCKFPRGNVVFRGSRVDAVCYLINANALTNKSNPAWCTLTPSQCAEVARRASLRAKGYAYADADGALSDHAFADAARAAADAAHYAADAARYAADAAHYAADAARGELAEEALLLRLLRTVAARAADAAHYAADAASASATSAAADERELQRRDKLELLGII